MKQKVLCLITISYCFIACNKVTGVYVSNYSKGADTIKILPNHKYMRIWYPNILKTRSHIIDTGKYEVASGRISFWNWHNRNGLNFFGGKDKFIFVTEIDRSYFFGSLRLLLDDNLGYYYIKDKNKLGLINQDT